MNDNLIAASRTLLIIEDSLEDRELYQRYLTSDSDYRYTFLEAALVADGLAIWRAQRPDCVLLDSQLPDGNGLNSLQTMMVEGGVGNCAIVMLTGTGDTQTVAQAMKAGAHDYLDKNRITAESLRHAVNTAVEKARLQRQLDEQREWFRVTLASIGDGVLATDTTGNVTFINEVAQHLTGWTQAEAQGQPITEVFQIINEETRATVESPVIRTLREGRIVGLANHTILIARDGREVPIDDSAAPIRDEKGMVKGAVLIFRDIAERKVAEAAMARLAAIITHSDDAIISKNLDGIIMSWNKGAERLFGYTAGEMIGRSVTLLIPDDHQDEEPRILARLRRGETIQHYETIRRRKDGSLCEVSLTVSPIKDATGRIIGASKVSRDITARKRMEEQLRTSEEQFRATFEQAAVGIAHVALDGRWLLVNQRLCEIVGYTREELLASTFQDITHPDDLAADLTLMQQVLAGKLSRYEIEKRYLRKDGSIVWGNLTVALVRKPTGTPNYFISVVENINRRKQMEEALRESNEELSQFNRLAVDRELRMIELKQEVNELCTQLGQPQRYDLAFDKEPA